MPEAVKASDLFLRCLEQEGVDTIFGVPGEENADLMISLLDSPIEFVVCRHEQAAAFMAEVYGRLTGKPGVCLATLGPGATNLVTGVANANFDRVPLVALTGQAGTYRLHKESHQNMDVVGMFRPITKWTTSIRNADNIPEVVHKAFRLAAAEKPGATHIELPEDVAKQETTRPPFRPRERTRRPAPDGNAVERAITLIRGSDTPIILAGNGCVRTRASRELCRFIGKTGMYSAQTFMGKGAVSDESERSLYAAGLGSRDHVTEAFEKADLVLAIGYDMIEWPPDRWNVGRAKKIIHIDFDPAEADEHYQTDVEIVGDVAASVAALNERLGPEDRKEMSIYKHLRDHMTAELRQHDDDESFPVKPQRILSDVRSVMGPEDILISDVGAHKMWVARHYPVYRPATCIISNGFCSMGIALPGAISAKRTFPERTVIGLTGDGGFLMNVQDLATAVQYEIPTTVLVWEDKGYGLIRWKQEAQFGRFAYTEFTNPDLIALAGAFGCRTFRVESAAALKPALEGALAEQKRPSVVVVPVDYSENLKLTKRLGELLGH
jgi:acetolactate synthase-1/2/3 large subunit